MPVRVVLNLVYFMLMENRDEKERREIDADLHGWTELNEQANRRLSGGED